MNRELKIKLAQQKVNDLNPKFISMERAYLDAKTELQKAKDSFDIGEKVIVRQYCNRGCCFENEFTGKIISVTNNGSYNIKEEKTENLYKYIYGGDMRRI